MVGNKAYVVLDTEDDTIHAIYGPFDDYESARAWPGMPEGPRARYTVEPLHDAPEWFEGYEPDGDPSDE